MTIPAAGKLLVAAVITIVSVISQASAQIVLPEDVRQTIKRINTIYQARAQNTTTPQTAQNKSMPEPLQTPSDALQTRTETAVQPEPQPQVQNQSNESTVAVGADQVANAPPSAFESRFAVGEELIYSLQLGDLFLGDVFAIRSPNGYRLGLQEFTQLVDFAIDVDIENVTASGWFIAQQNSFALQQQADESLSVMAGSELYSVAPARYNIQDDIYIELADIERWFGINTVIDEAQLNIALTSSEPFPIEQRLARQRKRFDKNTSFSKSVLPVKENGYKLLSTPLLDVQASTRIKESTTDASYSLLSSQDAGYFSSQVFLSGNDNNGLVDARLNLSRQSNNADLLGPLKMTEYAFGDVTPVNIGAGDTQAQGRGFRMSNARYGIVDNRRVNLVGEIQVGWDIELYRNGVLIDNRTSVTEGRYEFNDVELGFGQNDFEFVFYGPQGQIERRQESYYVDSNIAEQGESLLQFSAVQSNESLLGVGDFTDDPTRLGPLVSLSYDYGVTDWLSFGVGGSYFSPEQGDKVESLALRSNLVLGGLGLINSIFQLENDERRTMLHSFRTQIAGVSIDSTYRRSELLNESLLEQPGVVQPITEDINLRFSGALFASFGTPLNYQNVWTRSELPNGGVNQQFQNALGINSSWGSFSHGVLWQKETSPGAEPDSAAPIESTLGSLAYRNRFGPVFTRFFGEYEIDPDTRFSSVGTSLNYPITNKLTSELRYTYDVRSERSRYDLRLNWLGDNVSLSGVANYAEGQDWSINLILRFGLGYDSATNTFFTSGRALSQSGAVVLRMFEDENLDGTYNEGEPTLENVEVSATQAFRDQKTNEQGLAVLKSLPANRRTDIVVDESSFTHPSMTVATDGFAVASRRGSIQQFDIPVVRAGELDGVLYWRTKNDEEQAAPYVRMNMVNQEGEVVATTRTEFDGYYLFTKIMPGTYAIEVDTSAGRQRGMTPERYKSVTVSNKGDLITGVDMTLRELLSARGFVAAAGEFSSLPMLKLYLKLLDRRLDSDLLNNVFYYVSESDKYILGIAYQEGQREQDSASMMDVCKLMRAKNVACNVNTVEFNY
ncbi:SdrD B-like domain-containing protein [Alteromonas gilva]|uniref:SdrD B-like domain-containing protein n=1 Tax=Alteromonas gilva TaxID=2987522 RepID=A0ABT5KZZ8_9ALTE|nr:SdrD B-like domain-containing protein [Alteromonas gilva]MDC8829764.1 SdrD B-like domain-containing protein [Alteromonas gilva]